MFRTTEEDQIWKLNLRGTHNLIGAVQQHAPGGLVSNPRAPPRPVRR